MLEYSKSIFEVHLDRNPKYLFPVTVPCALDDIDGLKPSVREVQIHHHSSESAVVVEGSNLWFCYQVSFRGQKMSIPASDLSGSSIHFTVPSNPHSVSMYGKEIISLDNHFKAKPIRQEVEVFEKVRLSHSIFKL